MEGWGQSYFDPGVVGDNAGDSPCILFSGGAGDAKCRLCAASSIRKKTRQRVRTNMEIRRFVLETVSLVHRMWRAIDGASSSSSSKLYDPFVFN